MDARVKPAHDRSKSQRQLIVLAYLVMPALVPGIHAFTAKGPD
jgi:hypothetical protein